MKLFEDRLKALEKLEAYKIIGTEAVEEADSLAVVLEHNKTKARVFTLICNDENKVFTIGFRTPSADSTGVAHILEHCVLCGSEKFDVKDPFKELVKGSLNTFLNAMTYPDKTIYPVASCNDKDFNNLCDVYLDAVLHPNIYKEDKIFKQEGWHYEMDDPSDELKINGVVYNEMKGVFSSADGVLERSAFNTLFSGHSYGEESGGDPVFIPDLTYDAFLDFHARYYHPSNAFIYLYGDMDMAEKLEWMDREYLNDFEYREIDSAVKDIEHWDKPREAVFNYSITENESDENAAYLSVNTVVGCELDPVKYMGFQILDYVLLSVPGAPVREALIGAGIGEDIYGGYENGIKEPYFSIIAKNTDESRKDEFVKIIKDTLRNIAKNGIDKEVLSAAINITEFRAREADYGNYPKGLMYGLECFNSWLYDASPTMHLKYNAIFEVLREGIEKRFFEDLIRDYLLDNNHEAVIVLKPVKGLTQVKEDELKRLLKEKKSSLKADEIEKIISETRELKEYQNLKSSPEALLKIPMLKREELEKNAAEPVFELRKERIRNAEVPIIFSNIFTSGITYLKIIFDIGAAGADELAYISLLKDVLGYIDTEKQTYAKLATEINLNSGGVGFSTEIFPSVVNIGKSKNIFALNTKVLHGKEEWAFKTAHEILTSSRLDDIKRLKEIISEVRARLKSRLVSSGHIIALNRAGSYISKEAGFSEAIKGIAYYNFLDGMLSDWDNSAHILANKLTEVLNKYITLDNASLHIVGEESAYNASVGGMFYLFDNIKTTSVREESGDFVADKKNEGFMTSSRVNYVARVGNFIEHGFEYTGALKVLKVILSYDYLWNNVREKGGAYGVSAIFGRSGMSGFTSYRDPNIDATNMVYENVAEFIKNFDADEREMTKAVIGAVSDLDTPLNPLAKGMRGLSAYYSGLTLKDIQKDREEVLFATADDIRALAPLIEAVISDNIVCAIGNEAQIKESNIFGSKELLFSN